MRKKQETSKSPNGIVFGCRAETQMAAHYVKLALLQDIMPAGPLIIVDPKDKYAETAKKLGREIRVVHSVEDINMLKE